MKAEHRFEAATWAASALVLGLGGVGLLLALRAPPARGQLAPGQGALGVWVSAGIGGCSGGGIGAPSDSAQPDPGRCTPTTAGTIAICQGDLYGGLGTGGSCTYKNVPAARCVGDPNPGALHECRAVAAKPVGGAELFGRWQSGTAEFVGSSRVDLQACKLEYSIVSPK